MRHCAFSHACNMKIHVLFVLPALLISALPMQPLPTFAATGDPDTFDPHLSSFVSVATVQPGGLVLLGGSFNSSYSVPRRGAARFSSVGALDDFSPVIGGTPYCMAVQEDGKILAGGQFFSLNGQPLSYLARLNPDSTRNCVPECRFDSARTRAGAARQPEPNQRTAPRAATGHTDSTAPRRTPYSSSTMLLTTQQWFGTI